MTFLRSILAYFFAGMMINIFWPLLATPFGPFAGFIAGAIVIGPTWFICHYKALLARASTLLLIWGSHCDFRFSQNSIECWFFRNLGRPTNLFSSYHWCYLCWLALLED
nr:hypothetical protein [Streptococcus penaeicida]